MRLRLSGSPASRPSFPHSAPGTIPPAPLLPLLSLLDNAPTGWLAGSILDSSLARHHTLPPPYWERAAPGLQKAEEDRSPSDRVARCDSIPQLVARVRRMKVETVLQYVE